MASGELLAARVAIVDDEQKAALDGVCGLRQPVLRGQGNFDALVVIASLLRMDAVAIEEFHLFVSRGKPDFDKVAVFECEMEFALLAQDFDGERVKEFVGEDDQGSFRRTGAGEFTYFVRQRSFQSSARDLILERGSGPSA